MFQEATQVINGDKLDTIFEMAGLFPVIKAPTDTVNIVQKTINWYVLGGAQPAWDSFKEGLSTLGVLESMLKHPSVIREAFCFKPETFSTIHFDSSFTVKRECEGSNRREVENLVLSHWRDLYETAKRSKT